MPAINTIIEFTKFETSQWPMQYKSSVILSWKGMHYAP